MGNITEAPARKNKSCRRLAAASIAVAVVAGYMGIGGHVYFRKYLQAETAAAIQINRSRAFIEKIESCRHFDLLRLQLPELSEQLEKIAKAGGADSLAEVYGKIHNPMLKLMNETRMTHGDWVYVDDLTLLGGHFEKTSSKKERMALVFLSLPRLLERAISPSGLSTSPQAEALRKLPGRTIDEVELQAEGDFFAMLERNRDFVQVSRLLKTHWYMDDHLPPIQNEKKAFFEAFIRLY